MMFLFEWVIFRFQLLIFQSLKLPNLNQSWVAIFCWDAVILSQNESDSVFFWSFVFSCIFWRGKLQIHSVKSIETHQIRSYFFSAASACS